MQMQTDDKMNCDDNISPHYKTCLRQVTGQVTVL